MTNIGAISSVKKINMLIYVVAILDPQTKWLPVELILIDIYGNKESDTLW